MNRLQHSLIALSLAAGLVPIGEARGDTIQLKASVRLPALTEVVRLADIALINGEEAEAFAELIVGEVGNSAAPLEISVRDVRAILDEAGAHWGRINLSGRKVIVRPRPTATAGPPAAMGAVALASVKSAADRTDRREPQVDDLSSETLMAEPTLRGTLARLLVRDLAIPPADLRLVFDRDDRELLATSAELNRFELKSESSVRADRVTFTVRIWADGRVTKGTRITLRPLVRVSTAVLNRDLERDEMIDEQDFKPVMQWLSPAQADLTSAPGQTVGRLASKRLRTGETIRHKHIRRETLIERGDRVIVRCLVGGVAISMQAEAADDGAEGDTIVFRKLGERRTFSATVTGRGEAIVDLGR